MQRRPRPRRVTRTTPAPPDSLIEISHHRALYVGPSIGVGLHRSGVACLGMALGGHLSVRSEAPTAHVPATQVALVAAGLRHEFVAPAARVAFLYLEPTDALLSSLARSLTAVHVDLSVGELEGLRRDLMGGLGLGALPLEATTELDPRVAVILDALGRGHGLAVVLLRRERR